MLYLFVNLSFFLFFFSLITILGVVIIAFLIFVVHLRKKLPDGVPKPSMCTSMKVRRIAALP